MSNAQQTLRVIQITDPHLFADTDGKLKGVNTHASFMAVVDLVKEQQDSIDIILMTGDLVHDESIAGYQRLCDTMQAFGIPVYCLPGNHDEGRLIGEQMNKGHVHTRRTARHGDWLLVFLDSSIPGSAAGNLSTDEMLALEERVNGNDASHILVCVHHNPLPVDSSWLDTMTIANGEEFTRICINHPKVRGILFGHIHQDYDQSVEGLRLLGTPSTCIQFKPNSEDFALEATAPGYRVLDLYPQGQIESHVERIGNVPMGLDLGPEGY